MSLSAQILVILTIKSSHWKAYAQSFWGDALQPEVRTNKLPVILWRVFEEAAGKSIIRTPLQ